MALDYHRIRFAGQFVPDATATGTLHLIHASGRGTQVAVPAGTLNLGIVLAGSVEVHGGDAGWDAPRGHVFVSRQGALRAGSRLPAWWLMLSGTAAAWRPYLSQPQFGTDALFPLDGRCPRMLARPLIGAARALARGAEARAAADVGALCAVWAEHTAALRPQLERCSGRTQLRRLQTLQRLLHVQTLIRRNLDDRLDLERLARVASYSPSHLIRLYREVFAETPSEYAARLRFERAWRLVRETQMPVCEITEALGFESQSAFCRAFKQTFGLTTTQARQQAKAANGGESFAQVARAA